MAVHYQEKKMPLLISPVATDDNPGTQSQTYFLYLNNHSKFKPIVHLIDTLSKLARLHRTGVIHAQCANSAPSLRTKQTSCFGSYVLQLQLRGNGTQSKCVGLFKTINSPVLLNMPSYAAPKMAQPLDHYFIQYVKLK